MYSGNRCATNSRSSAASTSSHGRHDVGDQARPSAHDHRRLRHRRMRRQHRLDLARLDPEPADLHLLVRPAGEHQLPVRGPPRQVPGAVHPLTRRRTGTPRTAHPSTPAGPHSPAPDRAPATYNSPATPTGTGAKAVIQHEHPGVRDRPADRHRPAADRRRPRHRPRPSPSPRSARTCSPADARRPAPAPAGSPIASAPTTNARTAANSAGPAPATATAPHWPPCTGNPANSLGSSRSRSPATTNVRTARPTPPPTSSTDASKLNDANCNTPTPGTHTQHRPEHRHQIHQRAVRDRHTLRRPVDPDV